MNHSNDDQTQSRGRGRTRMWIAISELLAGGGDIGPCVYLLRTLKVLFHCWTGTRGEGGCWGWFLLHRDVSLTHQEIALDLLPMEDNRVACNLLFLRLLIMGKFLLLTLFFRSHIWYVSVHGWLSDLSALRSTEYICTTSNAKAKFTPRRGGEPLHPLPSCFLLDLHTPRAHSHTRTGEGINNGLRPGNDFDFD